MTLITYPTRVHFADGVLEEALRSELEVHEYTRPLILGETDEADNEFSERLFAGLPPRSKPLHLVIGAEDTKYDTAGQVEAKTQGTPPDVIIAYGSARAIVHARKCRHKLHKLAIEKGETSAPPVDIFAVPGIDGLPNPCRSSGEVDRAFLDLASRTGLPKIVICDPTVTAHATDEEAACSAADAFSRCLEAYLSDAYNPPADGMALDGFNRAASRIRHAADGKNPAAWRELMAANLNATLAQQKGIGPTQFMAEVLREPHGNRMALGALARILLPGVLGNRQVAPERVKALTQMLSAQDGLGPSVAELFEELPLAGRLSELGFTESDIADASDEFDKTYRATAQTNGVGARSILEAVF